MKTTTNRIRSNRSAAHPSPQAKTNVRAPRQAHPQTERTVTVVFFGPNVPIESDKSIITRVQFPETVFKRIQKVAKQTGVSLDKFFNQAFQSKLTSDGVITSASPLGTAQQRWNFRTLESSVEAAASLLMILGEKSGDRGLAILAENAVMKLQADFQTAGESLGQADAQASAAPVNGGVL